MKIMLIAVQFSQVSKKIMKISKNMQKDSLRLIIIFSRRISFHFLSLESIIIIVVSTL